MQKRRFLKKILTIFFLSTTVAAIQPPVVHATPEDAVNFAGEVAGRHVWSTGNAIVKNLIKKWVLNRPINYEQALLPPFANYRENIWDAFVGTCRTQAACIAAGFFIGRGRVGPGVCAFFSLLGDKDKTFFLAYLAKWIDQKPWKRDAASQTPINELCRTENRYLRNSLLFFGGLYCLCGVVCRDWQHAWQEGWQQVPLKVCNFPPLNGPPKDVCMICREADGPLIVPCPEGHAIHEECMLGWVKKRNTCPACSSKYPDTVIRPLTDEEADDAFLKSQAVREALSRAVRVYGPIAVGALAVLCMNRRAFQELDTIKKMWKQS